MFRTTKALIIAAATAGTLAVAAQAAPFHSLSSGPGVTGVETVTKVLSPRGQLQRLLKPHYISYPVTRLVREAAGDYDMVVFDHRAGGGPYRCTFITHRGKRAMTCD